MHNQPVQPLSDLEALRKENDVLHKELQYVVNCLSTSTFQDDADQEYLQALATHVKKRIGKTGDYASVLEICGVEEGE